MEGWKDIVKAALVGTASGSQLAPHLKEPLDALGIPIDTDAEQEVRLLEMMAAYSSFRKSGWQVEQKKEDLPYEKAPEDLLKSCSPKAANYLAQILKSNQEEIAVEWLRVMQEQQKRVPEELLPDLLAFGAMHKSIQAFILPVLGQRGKWLAQFNARWKYAQGLEMDLSNEDLYHQGVAAQRLAYLQALRAQAPAKALALLKSTWEQEDYQSRANLLKVLQEGLSTIDLAFIEAAQEDRRKEVRQEAAALLAQVPGSALLQRMQAAIDEFLQLNKGNIEVELPAKLSIQMKKDGIREHYKPLHEGKKANWLAQMIAMLPLSYWTSRWAVDLSDLFDIAMQSDYRNVLWWGWATAAQRQHNKKWLLSLHQYLIDSPPQGKRKLHFSLDFIYQDLPNALFNELVWKYMNKDANALLSDEHPAMTLLLQEYQHWEDELALEVVKRIRKAIANDSGVFNWNQKTLLKRAAYAVNPMLYEEIEKGWPDELGYSWQTELTNLLATLRFRKEILQLDDSTS